MINSLIVIPIRDEQKNDYLADILLGYDKKLQKNGFENMKNLLALIIHLKLI